MRRIIVLSDDSEFPVHYRWSGEEEDAQGLKIEKDYPKMKDYYSSIIDKSISFVELGYADRDDEVYLIGRVNNCTKHYFAIPMGFDPECMEISSYAKEIIGDKDFETLIS